MVQFNMADDREAAARLIQSAMWFQGPASLAEALLCEGSLVRLAPGHWAYGEGDEDTGLIIVIYGSVDLFSPARGDREVRIGQLGPGGAIGQTVRFGGGPRLVTAICAEACLLLRVSDAALETIARARPEVWRVVASLLYHQLRGMVVMTTDGLALAPRARLAARLHLLARTRSGPPIFILTQSALAEMIGVTRKTVNALLSEFTRLGAVRLAYRRLEVLDLALLRRIANG
jgi:CRP/FNR family cyclic AMP-dependent transcriptional regulator